MDPRLAEHESIVSLATALASVRQRGGDLTAGEALVALDDDEQLLFHHKDAFGTAHARFQQGLEEFVFLCNTVAMQQLQAPPEPGAEALAAIGELLTRAEQHTRRAGYLRSVTTQSTTKTSSLDADADADATDATDTDANATIEHASQRVPLRLLCLNNLACYHKHADKPLAAITCLEKALQMQLRLPGLGRDAPTDNALALTHVNLCTVLSQLGRHGAAAEHARGAIRVLHEVDAYGGDVDALLLLVAHYNLAVELEHDRRPVHEVAAPCDRALAIAEARGLDDCEVLRLLRELRRSTTGSGSHGRKACLSPRRVRPRSPRTLRQAIAQ